MNRLSLAFISLSSLFFSCSNSAPKLNPNLINANQGGNVSSQYGTLEIPGGALDKNTEMTVKDEPDSVSGTPPMGVKKVLFTTQSIMVGGIDANSVEEDTVTLNKPITWKSKWTPETLGGVPENLELFQVKEGKWVRFAKADVQIDLQNKWCEIQFKAKMPKSLILVLGLVESENSKH